MIDQSKGKGKGGIRKLKINSSCGVRDLGKKLAKKKPWNWVLTESPRFARAVMKEKTNKNSTDRRSTWLWKGAEGGDNTRWGSVYGKASRKKCFQRGMGLLRGEPRNSPLLSSEDGDFCPDTYAVHVDERGPEQERKKRIQRRENCRPLEKKEGNSPGSGNDLLRVGLGGEFC